MIFWKLQKLKNWGSKEMKLPPIKINIISLWKVWRAVRKFLHDQKVNAGKLFKNDKAIN